MSRKEEARLTRRQFVKTAAWGGAAALGWEGVSPEEKEKQAWVQAGRLVPEKPQLMYFQPEANETVREGNRLWREYEYTVDAESPFAGEAWMTIYGVKAIALRQVELKGRDWLDMPPAGRTPEQQRIVELFEGLGPVWEVEQAHGRQSDQVAEEFDRLMRRRGYDAVLATKTQDPGKEVELEVWDTVGQTWLSGVPKFNGDVGPIRALVLDTATGESFQRKQGAEVYLDNFGYQQHPVRLVWWGDISREVLRRLKLPAGGDYSNNQYPIPVRWKEVGSGVEVLPPEYQEIRSQLAPDYQVLAQQFRNGVGAPMFGTTYEQMWGLVGDGDTFSWRVDANNWGENRADWLQELMRRNGLATVREPYPENFKNQVRGIESGGEWGFPVSWLSQRYLLEAWAEAGAVNREIWSVNRWKQINGVGGGLLMVENVFPTANEGDFNWMGAFARGAYGDKFLAVDSAGRMVRGSLDPEAVYQLIRDDEGEIDWRKRIVWYW